MAAWLAAAMPVAAAAAAGTSACPTCACGLLGGRAPRKACCSFGAWIGTSLNTVSGSGCGRGRGAEGGRGACMLWVCTAAGITLLLPPPSHLHCSHAFTALLPASCLRPGTPQQPVRITPEFCFTHWSTQVGRAGGWLSMVPARGLQRSRRRKTAGCVGLHAPPASCPTTTCHCSCRLPPRVCSAGLRLAGPSTPTWCWEGSPPMPPPSATTPPTPPHLW